MISEFLSDTKRLLRWCWRIYVSIPFIFIFVRVVLHGKNRVDSEDWYAFILLIALVVLGFVLLVTGRVLNHGRMAKHKGSNKIRPKHTEYPDRIMKALIRMYDNNVDIRHKGACWAILCDEAGIISEYRIKSEPNRYDYDSRFFEEMSESLRLLKDEGYIFDTGAGNPYEFVKPTYKGITHGRLLLRPATELAVLPCRREPFFLYFPSLLP